MSAKDLRFLNRSFLLDSEFQMILPAKKPRELVGSLKGVFYHFLKFLLYLFVLFRFYIQLFLLVVGVPYHGGGRIK
jgi:hypothetical protein